MGDTKAGLIGLNLASKRNARARSGLDTMARGEYNLSSETLL